MMTPVTPVWESTSRSKLQGRKRHSGGHQRGDEWARNRHSPSFRFPMQRFNQGGAVDEQTYEEGLEVRKAVLGEEYVANALRNATPFTQPLQDLVTEFCWGTVWTREGLPRKTRSLLNIGMLVALNRPHELRIHVQGAIRNGCSEEEVAEVLLQAAVYAGIPAGVDGFRVARQAIDDLNSASDGDSP